MLGDFEHQRLLLQRSCTALAEAVATAGSAYAQVDDAVAGAVDAGAVDVAPDRPGDTRTDTGTGTVTDTGGGGGGPDPGAQGAGGSW